MRISRCNITQRLLGLRSLYPCPFTVRSRFRLFFSAALPTAILKNFKYVDTPLTFSGVNAAVSAQAEVRWHILLGVFVGAGASYHRIFYSGTDMSYLNTSLRAGYRF
jgi:hypothetical protein